MSGYTTPKAGYLYLFSGNSKIGVTATINGITFTFRMSNATGQDYDLNSGIFYLQKDVLLKLYSQAGNGKATFYC